MMHVGAPNTASPVPKGNGAATFGKFAIGLALLALLVGAAFDFCMFWTLCQLAVT
jgi:hypothetical protein